MTKLDDATVAPREAALRALVEKWRIRVWQEDHYTGAALRQCADELDAVPALPPEGRECPSCILTLKVLRQEAQAADLIYHVKKPHGGPMLVQWEAVARTLERAVRIAESAQKPAPPSTEGGEK